MATASEFSVHSPTEYSVSAVRTPSSVGEVGTSGTRPSVTASAGDTAVTAIQYSGNTHTTASSSTATNRAAVAPPVGRSRRGASVPPTVPSPIPAPIPALVTGPPPSAAARATTGPSPPGR